MPLRAIEGQTHACEFIRRALQNDRLHHAYLFTGPEGVGKSLAAHALAQTLLCTQPLEDGDACGTCHACTRVDSRQHADLHILERGSRKDGGRERTIKIAQVRELQRALTFKAFEGARRVVILEDAECMTPPTANALLKTLEEPGQDTYFVLVSDSPHRLLPTIISRCQRVRFSPLHPDLIASKLQALTSSSADQADILSRLAEGSLGRALSLAEDDLMDVRADLLNRLGVVDPSHSALNDTLNYAAELARPDQRTLLPTVFHLLRTWYRDVLALQGGMPSEELVNREYADALERRSNALSTADVMDRLERLNGAEAAIFERMANARLVLESLFVRLTDQLMPTEAQP